MTANLGTPTASIGLQATSLKDMEHTAVVAKVAPLFTANQKQSGILASVSLAQFILESGYGKSDLALHANILSMMLYILLGAYFSQMNVMRQAIALSLMEVSFMVLLKNNGGVQRAISALLILLAATFHTVAIVGVIPWILVIRSNSEKEEYNCFTASKMLKNAIWIAGIAFVAYSVIMAVAIKLLPQYAGYFRGEWSDANYNASLFNTLIQLSFAVVGAIVFRDKKLNKNQRFAAIMLSLTIIFDVLSMRMEIWGRIAGMFGIYTYLLWVPEITSEIHSAKNRVILNTAIVLFSAAYMLIVLVFRPEWTLVVPYKFR